MVHKRYDECLNWILRHPGLNPDEFLIIIKNRGSPHGLKSFRASEVAHASCAALILQQGTQIPLHRVVQIRNRLTGEILAGEELQLNEQARKELLEERPGTKVRPLQPEASPASLANPQKITVAIRAAYPEEAEFDWAESLVPFAEIGAVEVAFHKTHLFLDNVAIRDVVAPFSELPIKAASVHMAHANIRKPDEFAAVLEKTLQIAKILRCPAIVVHPSRGSLQEVEAFLTGQIDPLLEQEEVVLCWETFTSKQRLLSGIEGIAAFCEGRPWHAACYDTSHLHKSQKHVLADIKNYAQIIKVFHLSNCSETKQHLPLSDPEGALDFTEILRAILASGFSGSITLEYLKEHHQQLLEDARWIKRMLEGRRIREVD